jgi:hypothetical protein
VVGIECNLYNLETIMDNPPSIPGKKSGRGAFLIRTFNRCALVLGIILGSAFFLRFALSAIAFMGFLLPAPLPVLLFSSPPIFDNIFGWLGAIGLVGIGLGIAGAIDKTAQKVFPVLSSIWFGIAALSMCAWSIFIVGSPKMLPGVLLIYAVYGFLFGLVGLVFAAVCRWVLERKPKSIGVRVFSYASFFFYLVLIAAHAWLASHPFPPFDVLAWFISRPFPPSVHLVTWGLLMAKLVDAFVLFGIVFCIGASITLLRRMRAASGPAPARG